MWYLGQGSWLLLVGELDTPFERFRRSHIQRNPMGKPFFVYMLRCSDSSYYVGHTDELELRLAEHQGGAGCEYTRKRTPVELVWSAEFTTRDEAKAMEARLKGWPRVENATGQMRFDSVVHLVGGLSPTRRSWHPRWSEPSQEGSPDPERLGQNLKAR